MRTIAYLIFLVLLTALTINAHGQYNQFAPLKGYSKKSTQLITDLRQQTKNALASITTSKEKEVARIYRGRLNMLQELVEVGKFIKNDTLEGFVQRVMDTLLAYNTLRHKPGKILIMRETEVNAMCFGEGTFIVTLGLLSKIRNENHLAFAIAHEIAHFELDHVKKQIVDIAERKIPEDVKEQFEKIATNEITEDGMELVRNYLFSIGQFNRQREITADSLGFIYFKQAGFIQQESIGMLNILDSAGAPKYASANVFFQAFNFGRFPFKDQWLQRSSVYSKDRLTHFLVPLDSMKSHPEFVVRKMYLQRSITDSTKSIPASLDISLVSTLADFEMVHSALISGNFDKCLYYALQLKTRYPKNNFINITIGKLLVILSDMKQKGVSITLFVPQFTQGYEEDLRAVNSFLHNTTKEELSELTFLFLNHQDNFNPAEAECYQLLWRICGITQRKATQEKIEGIYKDKFPNASPLRE